MAEPVSIQELIANLAQLDAIADLLVEKGLVTSGRNLVQDARTAGDLSAHYESDATMSTRDNAPN